MPTPGNERTLVYKRTHDADPEGGVFGVYDCMGPVRDYAFDAVIGIGGIGALAQEKKVAGKINWIGKGARRHGKCGRGPLITFDHFRKFAADEEPAVEYPALWKRFCDSTGPRFALDSFEADELAEIEKLLKSVERARPSPGPIRCRLTGRCYPKRRRC
jgi:hypothetical protein